MSGLAHMFRGYISSRLTSRTNHEHSCGRITPRMASVSWPTSPITSHCPSCMTIPDRWRRAPPRNSRAPPARCAAPRCWRRRPDRSARWRSAAPAIRWSVSSATPWCSAPSARCRAISARCRNRRQRVACPHSCKPPRQAPRSRRALPGSPAGAAVFRTARERRPRNAKRRTLRSAVCCCDGGPGQARP